jgi:ribokinase
VNLEVAKVASKAGVPVLLDVGGKDSPLDPNLAPYVTICWPNETELENITGSKQLTSDAAIAKVSR